MLQSDANKFTANCFNGDPASCSFACPFHIDLRSVFKKAARGRWDSCYKELLSTVAFPSVACSICNRGCEASCQRTVLGDEPIAIKDVLRACAEYAKDKSPAVYASSPKEQRIAIIGAGICGLSAAFMLSQRYYKVVVFEKTDSIGGHLKTHPDFGTFAADFQSKFVNSTVEFELNSEITNLDKLKDFDAILVATGAGNDIFNLAETRRPLSYMSHIDGVFACGEMCGCNEYEAMAEGLQVPNLIESYFMSGNPDFGVQEYDSSKCTRYLEHADAQSVPLTPKSGDIYTKVEAKAEASRCLQCDCEACLGICELLKDRKKKPHKYSTEVYLDSQVRPPITTHSATRDVFACNLCGRCADACPTGTDLPGLFCFSRQNRVERNDYPPAFHYFWLDSQRFFSGEAAFAFTPDDKVCDYAFFPGCQLGATNPEYVTKAYEFLHDNYGAGIISSCCGAPSYWAGDIKLLDENTENIRSQWEKMGSPKLVTACSSCTRMLADILPEAEIVSLYTLLDDKGVSGAYTEFDTLSVFDPCSVRTAPEVKDSVRNLATASGVTLSDYDSEGQCCGHGGHIKLVDQDLYRDIIRNRAADSELPYLVYCVNCREVFKTQGKDCRHILEVALDIDGGDTPNLSEKRANGIMAKVRLLDKYKNMKFTPATNPWDDLTISISPEARVRMEDKMITDSNLREAIWSAEKNNEGFLNTDTGVCLCCLVKPALTYWVQYKSEDGVFQIMDAYCHRMHFREGE